MPVVNHTFDELADLMGGTVETRPSRSPGKIFISTDSRVIPDGGHVLFFALRGPNFDGHQFVFDAASKGAFAVVVSEDIPDVPADLGVIRVKDTVGALQCVAKHHREKFKFPVVAITGSFGKTMVKEWLYDCLRHEKNIVRSPKSYNSQLGVALSLLLMREDHDMAIIEAGISRPGEMEKLRDMIQPTEGIFTGIGLPHSENFSSKEEHRAEKMKLFDGCEKVYESPEMPEGGDIKERHSAVIAEYMRDHGYDDTLIQERIADLQPIALRLEQFDGIAGSQVINDAYHSDVEGLRIALGHQQQDAGGRERTLILSDVVSDRSDHDELYASVAEMVDKMGVDSVVTIGEEIGRHTGSFPEGTLHFDSVDAYLDRFNEEDYRGNLVLIKGARKFRFERIARRFQRKAHETVLEIDLTALSQNYHYFHGKVKENVRVMAMVKAFSYGAGSGDVARELERNRVSYLGVAYTDEGVQLREQGIKTPIMVMHPDPGAHDVMIEHDLEPVIFSAEVLDGFIRSVIDSGKMAYPVHIELDTGMHRLGFDPDQSDEVINMVLSQPEVKIASIYSHLAASEDPDHDPFTKDQISVFKETADKISEGLGYDILYHIANSAAITRFPEAHFDMVRLGIGLYGVPITEEDSGKLKPVGKLKTRISQIKDISPGESVGYGRSDRAKVRMRIAIIPIGYADGLSRSLSNGKGFVTINGLRANIFGKVCMDMTMVDVTNLDVTTGDEVVIFGEDPSIEEFAALQDTIPYEVLTGISARVKRVYVKE